ncbi:MAG: flagellar biosynthesis protein FlhF [Oligoflexia bacterium]|nr:flagellar biosynthesis protein FlhF [Oligoflexia bacterium]
MQVKKFEAKNIKEALQMVKQELGPDAIIISAKDNKKSFGLAGQGSIEITAAISEKSLKKKQFAESRLTDTARSRFKTQTASQQKKFIENTVSKYQTKYSQKAQGIVKVPTSKFDGVTDTVNIKRPVTERRYIDIIDEDSSVVASPQIWGKRVDDVLETFNNEKPYQLEDAANGAPLSFVTPKNDDVSSLKLEVQQLKELLGQLTQAGPAKKMVTQHPGADYNLPFELSHSFEKLQNSGIDTRFIVEILEKADKELSALEKKKKSLVDAFVARYIMTHTEVVNQWLSESSTKLHLFVGPSGQGKTSSMIKLASHFVLNEKKKVAIFTADHFKVGAVEQLKIFCQILNVPLEQIKHSIEFDALVTKYFNYDIILVDYPSMSLRDITEIDQLRSLMPNREINRRTHLVLSCTAKDLDAYDVAQRYGVTQFDDIIMTKIDESFNHGLLYNIQRKTQKPLYLLGNGTKIPEDIEVATRERVLDLIYKITKNNF